MPPMTPLSDRPISIRKSNLPNAIRQGVFDSAGLDSIIEAARARQTEKRAKLLSDVRDEFGPEAAGALEQS